MKKLYTITFTIIWVLSGVHFTGLAQCDNGVSTDPSNPTNGALPDDASSGPPYVQDTRYLNGLDWWNAANYPLDNMWYNPTQPYGNMSNIQSPHTPAGYYSYLNKNSSTGIAPEEMNPENGWELLLVNLGRYPDDITVHNNIELNSVPYLVFYHRYKGIIRVFVQYGYNETPPNAIDGVKINLYYNRVNDPYNLSGIFRLGEGIDRTLDQKTNTERLSAVAPKQGQQNFWMSGDFQVAYDPCVCHYPTDVKLDFEFFSTTSLKLYGRGITIEEDLIDANGNIKNLDYLNSFDFTSKTDAENGMIIHKKMSTMADDYINRLEAYKTDLDAANRHNNLVEYNLLVMKVFKTFASFGLSAAANSSDMTQLKSDNPEVGFDDSGSAASAKKLKKFLENIKKIYGEYSDYASFEGFEKKSVPEKPSMPTVSLSEMYFEGELFNEQPITGPQFPTPGSFKNDGPNVLNEPFDVHSYPVYNEALGVFALLEQPKVTISRSMHDYGCNQTMYAGTMPVYEPPIQGSINDYHSLNEYWSNVVQIKLKEDLKFAFNPALDIKEYDIKAAFVFKMKVKSDYPSFNDQWDGSSYHTVNPLYSYEPPTNWKDYGVNIESKYFEPTSYEEIPYKTHIVSTTPLEFYQDSVMLNTLFLPIDAFKESISSFSIRNKYSLYYENGTLPSCSSLDLIPDYNGYEYEIESLQLKLIVSTEFETLRDNGDPNTNVQIHSYEIDVDDPNQTEILNSALVQDIGSSSYDISRYPENISINNNIHFDGTTNDYGPSGGGLYRIKAWNDIEIDADLTVASGYNVEIVAGNEINVFPEANISPEIELYIEPVLDYSSPLPEASTSYVQNFCNGNSPNSDGYKARQSTRILEITEEDTEDTPETPEESLAFDFNLYPNPASDEVTVSMMWEAPGEASLYISDLSGKRIMTILEPKYFDAGSYRYTVNTSSLASGFYMVTLQKDETTQVKRLVIQ